MRFLCFFPTFDAVLKPVTRFVSSILRPSLQAPGTKLRFALSSMSSCRFSRPGYLILMRLCKIRHVLTISFTVDGSCCIVLSKTWIRLSKMPNAFSLTLLARKYVVENAFFVLQTSLAVRLHHGRSKRKCIIAYKVIRHILRVIR